MTDQITPTNVQAILDALQLPANTENSPFVARQNAAAVAAAERFPYESDASKIPAATKARIAKRAASLRISEAAGLQIATASASGWITMVLPSVERQGYHEDVLVDEFKTVLQDVHTLARGGVKAKYIAEDGAVVSGLKVKPHTTSRSLDIEACTPKGSMVYMLAKHTTGVGGSQNNQSDYASFELKNYRRNCGFILAIVLDGSYYETTNGKRKLQELRDEISRRRLTSHVVVGNHAEVKTALAKM
jgi:hypothetical protein